MTDTEILAGLVKPLEWRKTGDVWWRASSEIALYLLTEYRGKQSGSFKLGCNEFVLSQYHDTLKDAQDAAQAYHAARVLASLHTDKLRALVEALTDARDMLTGCTFQTMRINGRYIDRDETVANADAALAALQEPEP